MYILTMVFYATKVHIFHHISHFLNHFFPSPLMETKKAAWWARLCWVRDGAWGQGMRMRAGRWPGVARMKVPWTGRSVPRATPERV